MTVYPWSGDGEFRSMRYMVLGLEGKVRKMEGGWSFSLAPHCTMHREYGAPFFETADEAIEACERELLSRMEAEVVHMRARLPKNLGENVVAFRSRGTR